MQQHSLQISFKWKESCGTPTAVLWTCVTPLYTYMYMCNTTDRPPALRASFQKYTAPATSSHYGTVSRLFNYWRIFNAQGVLLSLPVKGRAPPHAAFSPARGCLCPQTCRTQRLLVRPRGTLRARPLPGGRGPVLEAVQGPGGAALTWAARL